VLPFEEEFLPVIVESRVTMPKHFSVEEFAQRTQRVIAELDRLGLDALLLFKPESQYYLTGYDSTGFLVFQCMVMTRDGRYSLLARAPDVAQANYSSDLTDIRVWIDGADANPAEDLKKILVDYGLSGKSIGIELDTFGLRVRYYELLRSALSGFCKWVDASDLVNQHRLVKSAEELVYVRRAAVLADEALRVANDTARPGVAEGELYARMHSVVFQGGGFYPASRWAIGSGKKAMLVRTTCDTGVIGSNDQVQLEFAAAYRHYHAGLMRTILTTKARDEHKRMHAAGVEALSACKAVCRTGFSVGDIFQAHAATYDRLGFKNQRFNACGYSLGATYAPSWMDWPMLHAGSTLELRPGMVFFLLMILVDHERKLTVSLGETVVVGANQCESLSRVSTDLVVN
jgi:Xaa-Pro dipeptidase